MPLIPYVDLEQSSPEVRDAFGRFAKVMNIFRIMAHADGAFTSWIRFSDAGYRKLRLDRKLRQLVILLVAQTHAAAYVRAQHEALGEKLGLPQAKMDAVRAGDIDSSVLSPQEKTLLHFSLQVIQKVRADEALVLEMTRIFSPREIVEVVMTIGQYMGAARLTETLRVDIDEPATEEEVRKALKLP